MRRIGGPAGATMFVSGKDSTRTGFPPGVSEAGPAPSSALEARVVRLAVVDVGGEDRSGRRLPSLVRRHDLLATVGVAHDDLCEEGERAAVRVGHLLPGEP